MSFSSALPEPPIASTAIAHARPATVAFGKCVVVDVRSMVFKVNILNLKKKHMFFLGILGGVSLLCWIERCFSLK